MWFSSKGVLAPLPHYASFLKMISRLPTYILLLLQHAEAVPVFGAASYPLKAKRHRSWYLPALPPFPSFLPEAPDVPLPLLILVKSHLNRG